MKKLEINIPIYDRTVIVVQADNISSIDSYIEDVYSCSIQSIPVDQRAASTYPLSNGYIFIGLRPDVSDKMIVHECGHATFMMLETIGINPVTDQETFCYIQEYMFDKIITWLKHD